jgi:hypothetical protein
VTADKPEPDKRDEIPRSSGEKGSREEAATQSPSKAARIPPRDPDVHETKRYMVGAGAPLAVTIRGGDVVKDYAPAILVTKLAEKISNLLLDLGGGFPPMLYGAAPGNSMTLYFGDPHPDAAQGQLPIELTRIQAQRIADLVELEGDELFAGALQLGAAAAQRYNDLTHTVQNEGVTIEWKVGDDPARILPPDRAERQNVRLSHPGTVESRDLNVHGVLYRVIAEPRDDHLGTVGIRLHKWSARPPGISKGGRVFPAYTMAAVEQAIKDGLINENVAARLRLQQAALGTSIRPGHYEMFLDEIGLGPAEDSIYGESMFDDQGDEE